MINMFNKSLVTRINYVQEFIFKVPVCHSSQFRQNFKSIYIPTSVTSWFPGHMYKGMLQLQAKLAVVDCIIEVHDARIPFTGRNPKFFSMLTPIKPHILVLNKCDLCDMSYEDKIRRCLQRDNVQHVLFTNCKENKKGIQKVIPLATELIQNSDLYYRGNRPSFSIMIIGIPNVGKSSVINRLRNYHLNQKSASAVGAVPGITKSVLEKIKVSDNPCIYLFDSPGIIQPDITSIEVGLKLALCRTLKENTVSVELVADYLLYWLNKHKNFSYVKYLNLKEPTDDIRYLLVHIAKEHNKVKKIYDTTGSKSYVFVPDIEQCSMHFLQAFRKGMFGEVLLDVDYLHDPKDMK